MSSYKQSSIFNAIISYFEEYLKHDIIITNKEVHTGIDVYFYFRPHLSKKIKKNSVITVHHDLEDDGYDNKLFIEQYRQATHIVCLNTNQYKYLNNLGFNNLHIIPHGYNENFSFKKEFKDKHKLDLGIVSKKYSRGVKGEALLKSLSLAFSPDEFTFTFIGEDREADAVRFSDKGFVSRHVKTSTYQDIINGYIKYIDVLLILSEHEGGPACLQEGLATSIPVVSTKVGASLDFIEEGVNGFLVDNHPDSISKALHYIKINYKHFFDVAKKHNVENKDLITWEEVVQKYENVFNTFDSKSGILIGMLESKIKTEIYKRKSK